MILTKNDFNGLNLRGLEVRFYDGYADIDLPLVLITIEKRPYYCDRGRYGFWVDPKKKDVFTVDFADKFPRYFFSLQRGIDEIADWVEFNKLRKKRKDEEEKEF